MGGEAYWYFEKYDSDLSAVLDVLREREFRAGRYNPVIAFPGRLFPLGPTSPSPGARHASIEEALADSAEDGTRSILDLFQIADEPDFCTVSPLPEELLEQLYGTARPTRAMIEQNNDFFESIERGQGVYIILYKDGKPDEILFAGYSFD